MKMSPEEWIISNKSCSASKTIWAVMMNLQFKIETFEPSVPITPQQFRNCYNLLNDHIKEWKPRLKEMCIFFDAWKPFVSDWEELEYLHKTFQYGALERKLYNYPHFCERKAIKYWLRS